MTALATIPTATTRTRRPNRDQDWPRRSLARSVGAYGLSARDLETLGWVSEQYAVRMDHLAVLLGRSPRTAQRFARRTRAGELAHCRPLLAGDPAWLWLTGRGQREAPTTFRSWSPRLGLLAHVDAVNRVRLHVQRRAPDSVWVCERSLARDLPRRQHLPDAVVHRGSERHALEVELTVKSNTRIEAILDELTGRYDAVVYFAAPAPRRQLERLGGSERWPKLHVRDVPRLSGSDPAP